jgi:hypothetical protein
MPHHLHDNAINSAVGNFWFSRNAASAARRPRVLVTFDFFNYILYLLKKSNYTPINLIITKKPG